ncbi:MAG: hypothetical protein EOM10_15845 [Opitutae bacterium]|nr:hypothetical protein [Opitutae bacterium]
MSLPRRLDKKPTPKRAPPSVTVIRPPAPPVDGQRWLPDAPAAIREGVLAWLEHQWGIWKPSQRQHHAQKRLRELRGFWQWQVAHRPGTTWAELRTSDIAAYMDAELARGIAPKTVKTTLDRVYEVARYLVGRGTLTQLPVRPALTLPDPLPRHLSPAEVIAIETVLHAPDASPPDAPALLDQALYYLLCHAGLRISEALDLKVQDVDLAGRRIRVREGKGRRDRVVYLSTPATQALTDYLPSVPHAPGDLVLSTQHRPVRYEEAWARMRALGRAAGVAGVSPHRLRHTYATQLLNHGMSLEGLRSLMGHENLETTLIYARLADTTLEQQYRGAMDRVTNRGNVKLM